MELTSDEIKVIEKIREVCDSGYGEVVVKVKDGRIAYSQKQIGEQH